MYVHPHHNNLEEFNLYVNNTLLKIAKENKEVYICGDFNINLLKYENDTAIQNFYNWMTSNGFLPHITLPTRLTDTTMSIIDYIYKTHLHATFVLAALSLKLQITLCSSYQKSNIKRLKCIKEIIKSDFIFSAQSFIDDIAIQNWNDAYNNTNDCCDNLKFRLEGCVNRHAPRRKLNLKEQNITNDILKKIKQE